MAFLSSHPDGYRISGENVFTSAITVCSGFPYAKRHYELSQKGPNWVAHRVIALIEFVPIIGGIVAIIERIAYAFFGSSSEQSLQREIVNYEQFSGSCPKQALQRMIRNQNKALDEHNHEYSTGENPYLSTLDFTAIDLQTKELEQLKLSPHFAIAQGPRPYMEDAHFYMEMEQGTLIGVFDGHGGHQVAAFANDQFQKKFPTALKTADGNVLEAFEIVIDQIHEEVANQSQCDNVGSTAVVSYIDRESRLIYTATLGDSEANIYRKTEQGRYASIPLSCVRNWLSRKDLERLRNFHGREVISNWIQMLKGTNYFEAKYVRSFLYQGVNVSRAIGDNANSGRPNRPLVIHKPKITVNQLKAKDVVILACDGLKDYVPENEIVSIVADQEQSKPLAQRLVDHALNERHAQDNVTVVVVDVT